MSESTAFEFIGVLGGTFDPVHLGHVHLAKQFQEQCQLDKLHIIPNAQPVHKSKTHCSNEHRLNMLELAFDGCQDCFINPMELERGSASYSIDTLKLLQQNLTANQRLLFIIGDDAFEGFDRWHQYQAILDYCHLIIAKRSGNLKQLSPALNQLLKQHTIDPALPLNDQLQILRQQRCGKMLLLQNPVMTVSSTDVRASIEQNHDFEAFLPASVYQHIKKHHLYS